MPNSLRCMISKLKFQGKISELECEELLKKLDNHDKELIKKQARQEQDAIDMDADWEMDLEKHMKARSKK